MTRRPGPSRVAHARTQGALSTAPPPRLPTSPSQGLLVFPKSSPLHLLPNSPTAFVATVAVAAAAAAAAAATLRKLSASREPEAPLTATSLPPGAATNQRLGLRPLDQRRAPGAGPTPADRFCHRPVRGVGVPAPRVLVSSATGPPLPEGPRPSWRPL